MIRCKAIPTTATLAAMTADSITLEFPTLAQVRDAIANRPRRMQLEEVAAACDVSLSWLKQVMSGSIEGPSYERIVAVYRYVKGSGSV